MGLQARIGWRQVAAALLAVLVALAAGKSALAFALQSRAPALALRFDPDNPVALVRNSEIRLSTGQMADGTAGEIRDIARESVRQLPLNAAAFRLFGLIQTARSKFSDIREQMVMAGRLSRRDAGSQLFLIEDAVARNDIAAALAHYDAVLRVEDSSRAMLYPVLTRAMDVPAVRRHFLAYMAAPPPWLESFLRYAISKSDHPQSIAQLARKAGGFPDGSAYRTLDRELMSRLVGVGRTDFAASYFRSIEGAPKALLATAAMTPATTDPLLIPASWQAASIDGINALFIATDDDRLELEASMDSGYHGLVARKMMGLKPGKYRLASMVRAEGQSALDSLRWTLGCAQTSANPVVMNTQAELAENFVMAGEFEVPADCPAQMLTILAQTRTSPSSVTVTIASPSIRQLN